jgi:chromosome segregation ATPase
MHIKSVAIQAFKSYKEAKLEEPLSGKCNLIVGQNGTGKSNFIDAIIFVLSDKYLNLSAEEKRRLMHESDRQGANRNKKNCLSVEIVLDNNAGEGRRLPVQTTENGELTIKKTYYVETGKEQYTFNGKEMATTEVFNIFESAGFSLQQAG